MPKIIQFEISDEQLLSLERYLDSNRQTVVNDAGSAESVRVFPTVEAFLQHNFGTLMLSVSKQFPTASMVAALKQQREIEAGLLEAAKPTIVGDR